MPIPASVNLYKQIQFLAKDSDPQWAQMPQMLRALDDTMKEWKVKDGSYEFMGDLIMRLALLVTEKDRRIELPALPNNVSENLAAMTNRYQDLADQYIQEADSK